MSAVGSDLPLFEDAANIVIGHLMGRMDDGRPVLDIVSRLARTNPLDIGLTAVPTGRRFRIRNRDILSGSGPATQPRVGIALPAAMGAIVALYHSGRYAPSFVAS